MNRTSKEGVVCVFNKDDELVAIIYKEMKSRKNIFYSCTEMDMTSLEALIGLDTMKITS